LERIALRIPVIIPARIGSTRFPAKPLAKILGKPMIQWVCELSAKAVGEENVYVATDSKEIASVVRALGYKSVMTSANCLTGTDRVAEAMRRLSLPMAINVQGDEPLLDPDLIKMTAERLLVSNGAVVNAASKVTDREEMSSSSLPKMVLSRSGRLLYASRSLIPGAKESNDLLIQPIYKQVCVYGFHLESLKDFGPQAEKSPLEQFEDIEILRFLEADIPVEIVASESLSVAVDFPEDIAKVEAILTRLKND
jgi:3-deoxy-manno-octulosonate cytidylyltransferase (CMP-KDO synthetase)